MDIKVGQDTKGLFAIIYGSDGIQWVRGKEAEILAKKSEFFKRSASDNLISGYVTMAGQIIEAFAQLGQWYELHQIRRLEEARFEERRIIWLVNCANLVLNNLQVNGRLDAKAAFYLSREASDLFEVCEKTPKLAIPGTILYMCYAIRRHLSQFNVASYEYISSVFHHQGALVSGSPLFGETLGKILGDAPVQSDASWLEYHSAEEQLEAMLTLASEKKSIEVDGKDVAKSAALLAAFIPIPVFWGSGVAARAFFVVGGMARGVAAGYSIQPLLQLVKDLSKESKRIRAIEEYHDLLLLSLEAANTARLLSVQKRLLEGTGQKSLILFGQSPAIMIDRPDKTMDLITDK